MNSAELKNRIASQFLTGKGLELGPLNNPIGFDKDKATLLYADRLSKVEALRLFPELNDIKESLIDADLLFDFDTDNLTVLREHKFNFLVANHVIEHLVNPIQFLKNVSDNLDDQGMFFLTVPDKDFTFDKRRQLTSNTHLWADYNNKVTKLGRKHIKEFLINKEPVHEIHPEVKNYFIKNGLPLSYYNGNKLPLNPFKRNRLYNFHRQRSIHVHVWNKDSFAAFFNDVNSQLNLKFKEIESHDKNDVNGEMIYLLQKH